MKHAISNKIFAMGGGPLATSGRPHKGDCLDRSQMEHGSSDLVVFAVLFAAFSVDVYALYSWIAHGD